MSDVRALVERLGSAPRYPFLVPGHDATSMNVAWLTDTTVTESRVRFGVDGLDREVTGESRILPFFYGSEAGVVRVHHAVLDDLRPGSEYSYQVGGGDTFQFATDDGDDRVKIHLFGDTQTLSNDNVFNGSGLVTELYRKMQAQLPDGDLILHVGDFTEDLSDYRLVRLFLEALEGDGMMASHPFVVAQGNHEACRRLTTGRSTALTTVPLTSP